jgi:hypothetical protein
MSEFKDLIKADLEEDFVPQFQDLSKKMPTGFTNMPKAPKAPMVAPSGAGGGGKPPKAPVAPASPTSPDKKLKQPGKPRPTPTTMKKQGMNENEERYHIYHKGTRVTEDHETVTANDVNKKYGGVKNLESRGFLLIPHKPSPSQPKKAVLSGPANAKKPFLGKGEPSKPGSKAKSIRQIMKRPKRKVVRKEEQDVIKSEVLGQFKPIFNDINEIAKKSPVIALNCLSVDDLVKANTNNVISGEHIPTDAEPAPKPKKVKGNKDEGSGGDVKKEEKDTKIPANKIIKPEDKKKGIKKYNADVGGSGGDDDTADEPVAIQGLY